jgi:hypothetical protein
MKKIILLASLALSINAFAQVPSYVPTNGLQGWWPFNGNANDASGNANNGTVNGATLTSDRFGNLNSAYSFNGTNNDIVIVDNATLDLTNFSISAWVELPTYNSLGDEILTKGGDLFENYEILIYGSPTDSGTIETAIKWTDGTRSGINSVTGNQHISLNVWSLITSTYDVSSGKLRMYINGLFVTEQTPNKTPQVNNLNLYFGHDPSAGRYHLGLIDDIGIWNRALDSCEIKDLYFASLGNCCNISVSTQPINQSVNISNNAQFTTASSDPLSTYQWQTDLGVGFQNLNSVGQYSGTANDTLTIANTTLSNNNQPFRCIISSGSCTDTSNVAVLTVNNNVGINEFTQDNLFSVYPNPAKSQINVKADAKLLGTIYTVYDNSGKLVLSGKINSENTVIDLGNLSGGIYLFSVGENMKQTFKVIKE